MSNGDDVLDNWEEFDEAGLCMTLQTKLQTANQAENDEDRSTSKTTLKPATSTTTTTATTTKMKLLQRPQSLQENSAPTAAVNNTVQAPKQIMIAKKPIAAATATATDGDLNAPVMMVLHKSASEYDAASYANPINNQTVKILRRPAQAEERRDANGMRPKQPIKTLQQREQEYAQARLRILGSAKNPEDDKPATPTTPVSNASTTAVTPTSWQATESTPYAANYNNNNNNNNNSGNAAVGGGIGPATGPGPAASGMHRSSSAPKMSQSATPMYNYNNYYQAPPPQPPQHSPAMSYIYSAPIFHHQRMPPYGAVQAAAAAGAAATPNPQQSWSPVVGGSVSAALLRQQSMHSPALHHQQQQQQHQQQHHQQQQQQPATGPPQYSHPYNDNVLRLPRGPCPNGTIGFQMRR